MRGKFIWDRDRMDWVPAAKFYGRRQATSAAVISDTLPDLINPANGKRYDSKSNFRRATKALGFVEVGNDADRKREKEKMPPVGPDVKAAIEQLRAGHRPAPLETAAIPGGSDRHGRYGSISIDRIYDRG